MFYGYNAKLDAASHYGPDIDKDNVDACFTVLWLIPVSRSVKIILRRQL